jgi:hypothetical protein
VIAEVPCDSGAVTRPDPDLRIAAVVLTWIGVALLLDAVPLAGPGGYEFTRQLILALITWVLLVLLLRRESTLTRVQTVLVVALATVMEYLSSVVLGVYIYRIDTVPGFVPPGHGLVYLAALALARSRLLRSHARAAVLTVVAVGAAWTGYGLLLAERQDLLGAFWFGCLLGFLVWGRARLLYVGAFVLVTYLELVGTALGTWTWQRVDPIVHLIGQGNPPSGVAGGYGWFDLWAGLLAPVLIARWRSARGERGEGLLVQEPVGGHGVTPERPVHPVQ